MFENIGSFLGELKVAARSLTRAKGLTATVVLTLALGIGANAAMFSLVRGVLLLPLVNRDEDRLIYIRQSEAGTGVANDRFSVPEIGDLRSRVKTLNAFGEFSTLGFTLVGLGEPRSVNAGVEPSRSEEHTSELQSHLNLVCRLLLEKKKTKQRNQNHGPEPVRPEGGRLEPRPPEQGTRARKQTRRHMTPPTAPAQASHPAPAAQAHR